MHGKGLRMDSNAGTVSIFASLRKLSGTCKPKTVHLALSGVSRKRLIRDCWAFMKYVFGSWWKICFKMSFEWSTEQKQGNPPSRCMGLSIGNPVSVSRARRF